MFPFTSSGVPGDIIEGGIRGGKDKT